MVQLSPKFIMTDADNAQYNACSLHFPGSKILMCWFHVCQNVKARIDGAKLDPITRHMIFRGLNDMHYARNEEEFQTKRALVLAEWNAASAFSAPFRAVAEQIIAQWILHPRLSQWQAYHTPPGCATTNNPLEQYHRTLKLVNKSSKATPTEMVEHLDRSRLVFANMGASFSSTPVVSERMKALYNLTVRKKELKATPLLAAGDLPAQLVQVRHHPRSQYGDLPSLESDDFYVEDARQNRMPYKSIHVRRMQWQGMPDDGWLLNGRSRTCACRFNAKFAICIHVIHCTRELELHCPGMPDPVPTFVSNQRSRGSGMTRRSRQKRSSPRNTASNLPTVQGTNTDSAQSNPEAAVDGPTYGPQRQQPTHAAIQHTVAYDDVAVQGPQPRCLSQSFSSNTSMTRESNQFTDESTNAEGRVANAYLSPPQTCSPRFDRATHPGGRPSPGIAFAPMTPTTHTATPVAASELPVPVSSRVSDTSVPEIESSDAYYATARLITAQHVAGATRLVSYRDNESSVTQEPLTLRRSCAQTKRRRV